MLRKKASKQSIHEMGRWHLLLVAPSSLVTRNGDVDR